MHTLYHHIVSAARAGVALGGLLVLASSLAVGAKGQNTPGSSAPAGMDGVGIEEQLGAFIPGDLEFSNAEGERVSLDSLMDTDRPVILNFVYHDCPMLCSVLLDSFTDTMTRMEWTPGSEFDVLTVSFSATETPDLAARQKDRYLQKLGREGAESGWHFLTGEEEAIQQFAASTGFQFKWVESRKEFAHPSLLIFLSPEGKITRYLHGLYHEPADIRKALVEASNGTVGTAVDQILMYCFQYDPAANSYVLHASNLMKIGALFTMLFIGLGIWLLRRRERKDRAPSTLSHATV